MPDLFPEDVVDECANCGKEIFSGPRHVSYAYTWFHSESRNAICNINIADLYKSVFSTATPKNKVMDEWW